MSIPAVGMCGLEKLCRLSLLLYLSQPPSSVAALEEMNWSLALIHVGSILVLCGGFMIISSIS